METLIALLQHLILKLFPALTVETTKHVWVTINRRVAQIAKPIQILKKVLKIAEKIKLPPFIHQMNPNHGRNIIVFPAI